MISNLKTTGIKTLALSAMGVGLLHSAEIEVDVVKEGKELFEAKGCIECHTVAKEDKLAMKTGPNLYGLFLNNPRDREVEVGGKRSKVKADRKYYDASVRNPNAAVAVAEHGPQKDQAYMPVMPLYVKELLSDQESEAIWHYLRSLADKGEAGPSTLLLKRKVEPEPQSVVDIRDEEIVLDRTRVIRASLRGTSGRALHVGQANGLSYTFDPRMLGVRRIWAGGYLNMKEERAGRGKNPARTGKDSKIYLEGAPVLAPLSSSGKLIDFEFKEPDAQDYEAIERHLWDGIDYDEKLKAVDAEFLGYSIDGKTGNPTFRFRVGENNFKETVTIKENGLINISLTGELKTDQSFQLSNPLLSDVAVSAGELKDGVWKLNAGTAGPFVVTGKLPGGAIPGEELDVKENWSPQELVTRPAKAGKKPIQLIPGYSLEDWMPPKDLIGREQLFEATGIDVAKDGTIVLATRAAGVWRIRDNKWTLFAEGTYEALGVVIEDDKGDVIVVAQKPEITRMRDTDGDGRADDFETMCDDYGFHGNYHEYTHGPIRDADGNYYFNLNLSHDHSAPRVSWRAGGKFMGSMGGYRGWSCRVTPEGKFEPFALGLRSPAGLGVAPDGRLWYAENQGEYCGSSKIVPLEKGKFYGHISGLITLPGMVPDSPKLKLELWEDKLRKGAVWLPHAIMANSPGNLVWDTTGGKFGVYEGQMFVGDQTLSQLLRVVTEQVDGKDQGCVIPFARGFSSGLMRPVFLPDGSLLIGQTGRGWVARGGSQAALQRVIYDGKTKAGDIFSISAAARGFTVKFTQPLDAKVTSDELMKSSKVMSWFYTNGPEYGSPQHEKRTDKVAGITISDDRKSITIDIEGFGAAEGWLDRLYHIELKGEFFGDIPSWNKLEGFYTLR